MSLQTPGTFRSLHEFYQKILSIEFEKPLRSFAVDLQHSIDSPATQFSSWSQLQNTDATSLAQRRELLDNDLRAVASFRELFNAAKPALEKSSNSTDSSREQFAIKLSSKFIADSSNLMIDLTVLGYSREEIASLSTDAGLRQYRENCAELGEESTTVERTQNLQKLLPEAMYDLLHDKKISIRYR